MRMSDIVKELVMERMIENEVSDFGVEQKREREKRVKIGKEERDSVRKEKGGNERENDCIS